MTSERKPCLPECRTLGELTMHVPGCPKVDAPKPAEPHGEPPIDFEAADFLCAENLTHIDPEYWREEITIARAYFAIKSERDALAAEVERLRGGYADAIEDIESWAMYSSQYFQQKHKLEATLAAHRAVLKGESHDR